MPNLKSLFVLMALFNSSASGQASGTGTNMIAVICKNGIILGGDSRFSVLDSSGQVVAWRDGYKKIYQCQKILFGVNGQYEFDTLTFNGLYNRFLKSNRSRITVDNFYNVFLEYAGKTISNKSYNDLKANQFIVCGYRNNTPCIFLYEKTKIDSAVGMGFKTNNMEENSKGETGNKFGDLYVRDGLKLIHSYLTEAELKTARGTISRIGGQNSVAYFETRKIGWWRDQDSDKAETLNEFVNSLDNGLLKMNYRSMKDSIIFRRRITGLKGK
ncbi:MAG: hypothetical protein M3N30_13600 [Bacteroidota bacterium]|nr:hypothetical protein [Bacteroidota bacterium]